MDENCDVNLEESPEKKINNNDKMLLSAKNSVNVKKSGHINFSNRTTTAGGDYSIRSRRCMSSEDNTNE